MFLLLSIRVICPQLALSTIIYYSLVYSIDTQVMTETAELNELFYQAGTLMFVGMAFVFVFLLLMIFVIQTIITPIGKKYGQEIQVFESTTNDIKPSEPSPQVIGAISAAITKYRSK